MSSDKDSKVLQLEKALAESQCRVNYLERLILAQVDYHIFVATRNSNNEYIIIYSEGEIAVKNKFRTKHVMNKKVEDLVGSELYSKLKPYYDQAFSGEVVKYRGYLLNERYYSTILSPMSVNQNGVVTEVVGNTRDITEEYYQEIEGKKKTEILDSIIKNNPFSIQILNAEGKHIRHNSAFVEMFKAIPDEKWSILNDPLISSNGLSEFIKKVFNGEIVKMPSFWYNAHLVNPKYPDIPVCLGSVIFPVFISNHKLEYIVVMHEDITVRVMAEEELIKAKNKAEEADRLKSAFLANMSHEIRTPMNGILGFAELLKNPELSGEKQAKYIGIIEQSGVRLLNIINDLINISKLESGLMEISITEVDINEQIHFVHDFFELEAERKGLYIKSHCPEISSEAKMFSDKEKFLAILTNLTKNAIKFTKSGGIDIGYESKNSEYLFFVKDTGIGIAKNQQEIIFDRFVQAEHAENEVNEGSGLGLSITKAFVEMLGGKIWVESEKRKGTHFFFSLPSAKKELLKTEEDQGLVQDGGFKVLEFSVLAVEDDETSLMFLSHVLDGYCKKVILARTGQEAYDICCSNPEIDLVLMDIKMPGMSGLEAAKLIKETRPTLPIIAQTAYALEIEKAAYKEVFNDYVTKPIRIDLLKNTINKVMIEKTE